jgi:lipid II:glycine glycyltransferase (peptidoglycan interpeptide bridge formation enzyme)
MSAPTTGPGGAAIPAVRVVREAAAVELASWDARTVEPPGGDVQQSRAWAAHRARTGWRPHLLVLDDEAAVLALGRRTRGLGGGRLYVPKGPVAAGADAARVAGRLAAVAGWAHAAGYDTIVADPEIPAASGFPAHLGAIGFHPVEEIGPSRHRVSRPVPPGADDDALLAPIAKKTRQRFLAAERRGVRVVRYDAALGPELPGVEAPLPGRLLEAAGESFAWFHGLLAETGARRGFGIGSRTAALAWWRAALEAGHLVLLEARSPDGAQLGAAIFFRHGGRLTYGHSGDVVELRHDQPGTVHLLLWRALQLAAREGRAELDLGGVDVRGARREPLPGEPMHGLLEFKRSFGGEWLELSGAHERVLRPGRHALAAGAGRAVRAIRSVPAAMRRGREDDQG